MAHLAMSRKASKEMCAYCFDVLLQELHSSNTGSGGSAGGRQSNSSRGGSGGSHRQRSSSNVLLEEKRFPEFEGLNFPLFVTWNSLVSKGQPRLRGCIGTFIPQSVQMGLHEYTLKSAFEDGRFSPIQFQEISKLQCSVSLLTDFEPARDLEDWTIGTHGITIEFQDQFSRRRSATYLPEVAPQQGWSKDETLQFLFEKAGVRATPSIKAKTTLTRYQSSKCSLVYDEYLASFATPAHLRAGTKPESVAAATTEPSQALTVSADN